MAATVIDDEQRAVLERYLDELYVWNRRINLTTVARGQAWSRHIEEALSLVPLLPPGGVRILDLGSGAGLPGIPLAVVRPECSVTLLDSDLRKAQFLNHVCGLLGLDHVVVEARRAEALARTAGHGAGYDVVVSRAAAPPAALIPLALPLLRPGGLLLAQVALGAAADGAVGVAAAAAGAGAPAEPVPGVLTVRAGPGTA